MTDGEKMVFAAVLMSETNRLYADRIAQAARDPGMLGNATGIDTEQSSIMRVAVQRALLAVSSYRDAAEYEATSTPSSRGDLSSIFDIDPPE